MFGAGTQISTWLVVVHGFLIELPLRCYWDIRMSEIAKQAVLDKQKVSE